MKHYQIIVTTIIILIAMSVLKSTAQSSESRSLPKAVTPQAPVETSVLHLGKKDEPPVKKQVLMDLSLTLSNGKPFSGVSIGIFTDRPEKKGQRLGGTVTDSKGRYALNLMIPSHVKKVYIAYNYPGLVDGLWLELEDSGTFSVSFAVDPLMESSGTITMRSLNLFV